MENVKTENKNLLGHLIDTAKNLDILRESIRNISRLVEESNIHESYFSDEYLKEIDKSMKRANELLGLS